MDTRFTEQEIAFRDEVRQFFAEAYTNDFKPRNEAADYRQRQIDWQKVLYERGWAAPGWPREFGGPGWTPTQRYLFEAERANADAPDVIPFGLKMAGPTIYTFGNKAQKAYFLPRILKSEDWWCQGYSEPGAGSDLAALKTRAVADGDDYIVNGAKIWTTYAHYADWIFALVRTSSEGKRQQGISFLLIDMTSPGIKVNPIITLDGQHSLNEVEIHEVRVPMANRIGEENKGWTYAKALLMHERTGIAGLANSMRGLAQLRELAATERHGGRPLLQNPSFQRRLADVEVELLALEFTELRVLSTLATGAAPGPESSLLKIKGTEIQQALQELSMEAAGYYQGVLTDERGNDDSGHPFGGVVRQQYMYGRAATVYAGSNEVQKNIIAKAVLGLA